MSYLLALESQQLIIIGLATVAAVLLLLRLLRSWREPSGAKEKSLEGNSFAARDQQPPDEFTRWEVQMHDTARELKAELDSKMVALQVLIRQAEQECQRLEKLLGETRKAEDEVRNAKRGMRSGE
jgi:hypothetical protein